MELCQRHLQAGTLPTNHGHAPQLLLLAELSTLLGTTGASSRACDTTGHNNSRGPKAGRTTEGNCDSKDRCEPCTTEPSCTTRASCADQPHSADKDRSDPRTTEPGCADNSHNGDSSHSGGNARGAGKLRSGNKGDCPNGDGIDTGLRDGQYGRDPAFAHAGHTRSPRPARQWLRDTWAHRFGVAPAELGWGGPISTETLRRISCDASVTPVLVDPHGVPLRVGRAERIVTPGIWTALVARDRGCAFPTCTRPPAWCHAHHIRHWADGGGTDLENMVLLCAHHHRVIHHGGWEVHIGPDGHPVFVPPPWVDPDRTARRNTRPRHDHQPPPSGEHQRESDGQRTRRHRTRPPPPDT
ncbi:DUF222 domain-containing protein [Phytoactinopolyspora sp. XMNu-373]|uniref:DUF222 domain-containing protein n=1 Tax=Phytoactinopolyspora mesophila TaxID=2650750 RepID=A0A7K3M1P6_9ACTN|nr:DUF222 domain-containing protein [Phytoactinopolyspora mesophila]